jgi:hypothetical protein
MRHKGPSQIKYYFIYFQKNENLEIIIKSSMCLFFYKMTHFVLSLLIYRKMLKFCIKYVFFKIIRKTQFELYDLIRMYVSVGFLTSSV